MIVAVPPLTSMMALPWMEASLFTMVALPATRMPVAKPTIMFSLGEPSMVTTDPAAMFTPVPTPSHAPLLVSVLLSVALLPD